jgi:hypothetical protein
MSNGKKSHPNYLKEEPEVPEEEHLDFYEFEDESYVEDLVELDESESEDQDY